MNIIDINENVINNYGKFVTSFIDIEDNRIKEAIDDGIKNNRLWKEPLIQFNPSYEDGDSIEELCNAKILEPEMGDVFKGYKLYKHQTEALKKGVKGDGFIVTSGTGSGKSLTFIGTIYNYLFKALKETNEKGLRAIIVYPMNALINSQYEELEKHSQNYSKNTNKKFPFTFKKFTGQEKENERSDIRNSPPDILLTNYMMLELILTRTAERTLRRSISDNLKFLVFDELHIYRGRQGSDVSLLVRRIKALAENKLTLIGTSATMASSKNKTDSKSIVASAVSIIFGQKFTADEIITETIKPTLIDADENLNVDILKDYLLNGYAVYNDIALRNNILAKWIEANAAICIENGKATRRIPLDLKSIAKQLNEVTSIDLEICNQKIKELLLITNQYNTNKNKSEEPILPFKLNQFISQSGSVKVTLQPPDERYITINDEVFYEDGSEKLDLYTVVFNYYSGKEYLCVRKDVESKKLQPRAFGDFNRNSVPEYKDGYLFFWDEEFDYNEIEPYLADSWKKKDGTIHTKYAERLPTLIYFDKFGNISKANDGTKYKAYYIEEPIAFEPVSGIIYNPQEKDRNKFTTLGTEGRSTSTDILVLEILNNLRNEKINKEELKVLSFVDNRQDASLQAGHFNDFIKKLKIRIALYKALQNTEKRYFTHADIAEEVFNILELDINEYALNPPELPSLRKHKEETFKNVLFYYLIEDLELEWRIILPNLERTGLLKIEYLGLKDDIDYRPFWEKIEFFKKLTTDELYDFIYQTLNYIRTNYAVSHRFLAETERITKRNEIMMDINSFWGIGKNSDIKEPSLVYVEKPKSKYKNNKLISIGEKSAYGRYLKLLLKQKGMEQDNINELISEILDKLNLAGYLTTENKKNDTTKYFSLDLSKILWVLNDDTEIEGDKIRKRSFKKIILKPNQYFKDIYSLDYEYIKLLNSKEHTAQINGEKRKEREDKFKKGEISLLSCSPTMELGIDISTLNIVHLRNVPPNPANYAQRAGRAGRSGQAALIYTFCGRYSEHDQHFYRYPEEMVAGVVEPPRIDLYNEDLLKTHLYAVALSYINIPYLNEGVSKLVNLNDDKLELTEETKLTLKEVELQKAEIISYYKNVIKDFESELKKKNWYNDNWIDNKLNKIIIEFDESINRWRNLFNDARRLLNEANETISNPLYTSKSDESKSAFKKQRNAVIQMDLLQNEVTEGKNTFSEFYPYRYFAAEGFLPGYNFTRLPIRAFIPSDEGGEFISRPRFLTLSEFGPQNLIYHDGHKYRIYQLMTNDLESRIRKLRIEENTGYALEEKTENKNMSPFTGEKVESNYSNVYVNLIPMNDSRTKIVANINCLEEERTKQGYEIKTYFTYHGDVNNISTALVKYNNEELLKIKYLPAATIIRINERWKSNEERLNGFKIDIKTGIYQKEADDSNEPTDPNIKLIKLYTDITADAIYIFPTKALNFKPSKEKDAIITLQFAFKKAIEKYFKIENNEIEVLTMGSQDFPNMLIYESAEGSLGILSQISGNKRVFTELIKTALEICYFKDGVDLRPDLKQASYEDLLSYSNQMYHKLIDRYLIKEQLEVLLNCSVEVVTNANFYDADAQYSYLLANYDKNSSTEKRFLDFLYANGYKLPDEAQPEIEGLYVRPDFYYKETNTLVFCDGTPHDKVEIALEDINKREGLKKRGYDIFVYYYKNDLDEIINSRTDIFKKVK